MQVNVALFKPKNHLQYFLLIMSNHDSTQCAASLISDGIGVIMSLCFIAVFVWKLWFTEKDQDKVTMFHLDKPVLYLSYFFFLLSASTFALNMVYVIMSCFSVESESDKVRFDIFLILLILSESTFKSVFSALMTFQLFHAFRGQQHALSDITRFILMIFIGLQFCIEILYDINLSFNGSNEMQWNRMLPAIYLLIDLGSIHIDCHDAKYDID